MKFAAVFAALIAVAASAPTTSWTLNDLSEAIQNPNTPAGYLPYLEHAINQMMEAMFSGQQMDSITILTPGGLLPIEALSPAAVMPAEVDLTPVVVSPAPVPAPAVIEDAEGRPLVQIIVNIESQQGSVAAPAPVPSPVPSPVVVPEAVYEPQPLPPVVVPEAVYQPQPLPVAVVPEVPVVVPEPVQVVPEVPNPIDIIAIGEPQVNPIDLLQPTPVVAGGAGQGILV